MAFLPNEITKEHVLKAVEHIEKQKLALIPSTRWLVEINGKDYPPKEIMRYAHEQMNGEKLWYYGGGDGTNKYLKRMGFSFQDMSANPIINLIERYKSYLRSGDNNDEIYKWNLLGQFKGRPDIEAKDFYEEIKSINFANLIYPVGISAIHHLAKDESEDYRACFKVLFDETLPLQERVSYFNKETLKIYRRLVPEEKFSHHQDERTIATFLTYRNPDKYTFYKDSFYQKYCKLIGIKAKKVGEKYLHYLELVEDLISEYINEDAELLTLFNNLLPLNSFKDINHKILAQDILYTQLDKAIEDIELENFAVYKVSMGDFSTDEIEECLRQRKIIVHSKTRGKGRSNEKQGETFMNMREGDYFYMTHGNGQNRIKIIGRIVGLTEDSFIKKDGDDGWMQRSYDLIANSTNKAAFRGAVKWWTPNNLSTCIVIKKDEIDEANKSLFIPYFKTRFVNNMNDSGGDTETTNSKDKNDDMKYPLNQILYGPPGTGKTYTTINKALEIIGYDFTNKSRKQIKIDFDAYIKSGQIVFTTFHQSMCYEDFIEGLKPLSDDSESVNYDIEPGIFKRICNTAHTPNAQDFDLSYEKLKTELVDKEKINLKTPTGKEFTISLNSNDNLTLYTGVNKNKQGVLTKENIQRQINGEKRFDGWEGYFKGVLDYLKTQYNYSDKIDNNKKNFVLIIDEINRGNVSQIFGELITLIEEDKRIGNDESLMVTLPYSKKEFGVPPNLYIIGTMNTADRSVEALDTALRRRFSFEEMPPKPELVSPQRKIWELWWKHEKVRWEDEPYKSEEIKLHELLGIEEDFDKDEKIWNQMEREGKSDLQIAYFNEVRFNGINPEQLLRTINQRIEKLLDKDHQIGHSYFMSVYSIEDLKIAFYNKIIPLLQEYFFGDYGKLGLVLGEGFLVLKEWNKGEHLFADFKSESASDFDERPVYEIVDYRKDTDNHKVKNVDMTFEKAIQLLMRQSIE